MKNNKNKDILIVIDGNSLVNRAFFALPPMNTVDGQPTQAVYGFIKMLFSLIPKYNPSHMAVAFDLPYPTFRHIEYAGYKATRKGMPEELASQMPILKDLLRCMNIAIIEKKGYEADDIIGTLTGKFNDIDSYIVTGDGDSFQLINDSTTVLFTKKGISQLDLMTKSELFNLKQLRPSQIVDYKALCGDSSDNIPGVKGIGEKGAMELLSKYDTLDGVYQHIDEIKGAIHTKLTSDKINAYMSYKLATIDVGVPLDCTKSDLVFKYPFTLNVKTKFAQLGFKSLVNDNKFFNDNKNDNIIDKNDNIIDKNNDSNNDNIGMHNADIKNHANHISLDKATIKDRVDIILKLLDSDKIDNTICLNIQDKFICFDFLDTAYVVPLATGFMNALDNGLDRQEAIDIMLPLILHKNTTLIVWDLKALLYNLNTVNIDNHALNYDDNKFNEVDFFDIKLALYLTEFETSQKELVDLKVEYNKEDTEVCALLRYLYDTLKLKLKLKEQEFLYYEIEKPLVKILFSMESRGIKVDIGKLKDLGQKYTQSINQLSNDIQAIAKQEFNVNSPKQLAKVLFSDMQLEYPTKSKTQSTSVDILNQVKDNTGIIALVLKYRELSKLNSTYVEGLLKQSKDSVIHTQFKQVSTVTGRLSSVEPNLQNIPIRTAEGRVLRQAFVAREGYTLISADYSQIELRLLAHLSQDQTMRYAFNNNEDIHTATASEVFSVDKNCVTKEQRQAAKAVNFGIVYGISEFSLAKDLDIAVHLAKEYITKYFNRYSQVKQYIDDCVRLAKKQGGIATMYHRERKIPELSSPNYNIRQFGERAAMNMPMQGSAADIVKLAMIKVYNELKGSDAKILLQVHDELIVECVDEEVERVASIISNAMQTVVNLSVPLTVDIETSKSWGS